MRVPCACQSHQIPMVDVMDVVPAKYDVDRRVELNARDLSAAELLHVVDVVDVVVLNEAEHAAHTSDDAGLFAVVDVAAPHDVTPNLFLQPAVILSAAHGVALHLRGALHVLAGEVMIVLLIVVLPQGDAGALAVADIAILDDPALGPVRADHAALVCGRAAPMWLLPCSH